MQEKWRHRSIWRHKTRYWFLKTEHARISTRDTLFYWRRGKRILHNHIQGHRCQCHTQTHMEVITHEKKKCHFGNLDKFHQLFSAVSHTQCIPTECSAFRHVFLSMKLRWMQTYTSQHSPISYKSHGVWFVLPIYFSATNFGVWITFAE